MALNASKIKQESNFERPDPLEPGTYPARVVQILSLGLQAQPDYKGQEKPPKQELMVTYEFLDEFLTDKETGEELEDKPRWLSETFPLNSLDSDLAKSTKRYFAIDPDNEFGGDWAQLAGMPVMVTLVQNESKKNGKVYENITGVSTMRSKEANKAPDLKNDPKVFDIDDPDMEVFGSLPQWIQDKMKDNLEFAGSALEAALEGGEVKKEKKEEKTQVEETTDGDEGDDW